MSVISFRQKGDFKKFEKYLKDVREAAKAKTVFDMYGRAGVQSLSSATPIDSGLAASSWYYETEISSTSAKITFYNSDIENGFPVAIMLQYGHGTGTGGWVEGRDYINPAIQPIFDKLADDAWKEVTRL